MFVSILLFDVFLYALIITPLRETRTGAIDTKCDVITCSFMCDIGLSCFRCVVNGIVSCWF